MPDLNFTSEEYRARLERTRKAMQEQDIELLLVSDPSNMGWLTGYDGWSFYVHQCVLVPPQDDPVWYGRKQDAQGALRTVYMDPSHIIIPAQAGIQKPQEIHDLDSVVSTAFRPE